MPIFPLNRDSNTPLTKQLFDQIQKQILDGELKAGYRLPSSRNLAEELAISRNIVLDVFDQLIAEGYLQSKPGAGTYVADGAVYTSSDLSTDIAPIDSVGFKPIDPKIIDFRSGIPDLSLFPINLWIRLTKEVYQSATPAQLAYGSPEGRMELRKAIAEYVRIHRGVKCHPEQILVTAGTTQAIGLISRLLLKSDNKSVFLEDPITCDIQSIIKGFGGIIHPIKIDDQGIDIDVFPEEVTPRFVYVTPSHQFPLGVTMPIQRRIQLLEYAVKKGIYIIEDDYDSEFRFDGMPVNAIQGLDPENVIYLGTFSKTLCPSLRMGYIIFPMKLIELGRQIKWFTDLHNATMDQLVLAKFIANGHFSRFVGKMKKAHKRKRFFVERELKSRFGKKIQVIGSSTGLHMAVRFKQFRFTKELISNLEENGVKIYPVEEHTINKGGYEDTIIIGYGMLQENQIKKGIKKLQIVLSAMDTEEHPK